MTEARRRGDTRARIQQVALELFAEQGYDKTSLREIAERLGVTKAALYYHFRTKEDIIRSLFDDLLAEMDEIIEWGKQHESTQANRQELVRRYAGLLAGSGEGLIQFVQGNQSAVRDLEDSGEVFRRFRELTILVTDPEAPLVTRLRNSVAIPVLHIAYFSPFDLNATPEERRGAALDLALELLGGGPAGTQSPN